VSRKKVETQHREAAGTHNRSVRADL